jgi:hypothetical protein
VTSLTHVTSPTLNRLGAREAAAIIAGLAGNKALPADVLAEIVERADGIPLFVEEMTKAVLEAESEGAVRRTVAAVPSPALAVLASLHAFWWRGSTGSGRPRRWRRSARLIRYRSTFLRKILARPAISSRYSSSKPWVLNFSVRLFSVTVRTTFSGAPV